MTAIPSGGVCRGCGCSDPYAAGYESGYRTALLDVRRAVTVPPPVYRTVDVHATTHRLERQLLAMAAEAVVVE